MRRIHARAAVGDSAFVGIDAERREPLPQLLGRLEPPVGTEVLGPRGAERAGYVPGLGVDGFLLAAIALARPRVDERHTGELANVLEVEDPRPVRFAWPGTSPGATAGSSVSSGPPHAPMPPSSTACDSCPKKRRRNHRRDATEPPTSSYATTFVPLLTPARCISISNCAPDGSGCLPPPFPVTASRSTKTAPGMCPLSYASRPFPPSKYQRKSMIRRSGSSMWSCNHSGLTIGPKALIRARRERRRTARRAAPRRPSSMRRVAWSSGGPKGRARSSPQARRREPPRRQCRPRPPTR